MRCTEYSEVSVLAVQGWRALGPIFFEFWISSQTWMLSSHSLLFLSRHYFHIHNIGCLPKEPWITSVVDYSGDHPAGITVFRQDRAHFISQTSRPSSSKTC